MCVAVTDAVNEPSWRVAPRQVEEAVPSPILMPLEFMLQLCTLYSPEQREAYASLLWIRLHSLPLPELQALPTAMYQLEDGGLHA